MRRWWRRDKVKKSQSPRVPKSKGPRVPGSKGPRYLKVIFKYELDSKEGPSCSIIKTRIKAIWESKIKDWASLNMSATRSGRTWLLLLFRWLDSYCVKALVLSLNWLEPRTWIFIKYWCHYGLSIDGYEIFWSRNVILQTDGKRNLSSNLMLNSVGVIKSHFLTCNGEILIRITSSKYSVKHS